MTSILPTFYPGLEPPGPPPTAASLLASAQSRLLVEAPVCNGSPALSLAAHLGPSSRLSGQLLFSAPGHFPPGHTCTGSLLLTRSYTYLRQDKGLLGEGQLRPPPTPGLPLWPWRREDGFLCWSPRWQQGSLVPGQGRQGDWKLTGALCAVGDGEPGRGMCH